MQLAWRFLNCPPGPLELNASKRTSRRSSFILLSEFQVERPGNRDRQIGSSSPTPPLPHFAPEHAIDDSLDRPFAAQPMVEFLRSHPATPLSLSLFFNSG